MTFVDAGMLGMQAINNMNAYTGAAFDANMAAAQANSNAMIGAGYWNPATSPNTNPATGMTYPGAGMVQSYPSFGEASYVYPGYGPRPGVPTQQPDYSSYAPEQAFSPSGGAGGYYPANTATPYDSWNPSGEASVYNNPNIYSPFEQYANGGFDPFTPYPGAAQPNVGSGWPTAAVQPQEPAYQPYTNPYTGYPFNEAYPPGQYAPQSSPSYEWPPAQSGGRPDFSQYQWPEQARADWEAGQGSVYGGGAASAAAAGQGNVYGGGAASAAPAYNPFDQYRNGGYDPFTPYPGAAQPNVGSGFPASGGRPDFSQYQWPVQAQADWEAAQAGGGSFNDRAWPPQLPDVIGNGGYPTLDQRWSPLYEPYNNAPLNNALFDRSMQLAPETGIPADWGGGGGRGARPDFSQYQWPEDARAKWEAGLDPGPRGGGYNPFQQYQSGGYDPFASSYENDLNQILRGIDQGPGQGPSYASPDTLQPGDYGARPDFSQWQFPVQAQEDWAAGLSGSAGRAFNTASARDAAAAAIMAQGGDEPSMANFQSPANDYNTFQGAAQQWQTLIPKDRTDPNLINTVYKGAGDTGVDPSALANLFTRESTWNPRLGTIGGNYGLGQIAPDDFKLSGGTLGGLTYSQYTEASADQQAGAYFDFLDGILSRNPDLNITQYDAPTQYALLQALNFTPWSAKKWLPAFLNGDYSVQTGPPQGGDMNDTSIAAMIQKFKAR